jgi:hypothetical protein
MVGAPSWFAIVYPEIFARFIIDLPSTWPPYGTLEGCGVQSNVMIATIHRKSSHPAPTNNVPTIKSVPYQEMVVVFRRPCRLEVVSSFVGCDGDVRRALVTDAVVIWGLPPNAS